MNTQTGTVKWFNDQKGYGFIRSGDGSDVFVHATGLQDIDTLQEGQRVEFRTIEGRKGTQAVDVRPV
jgi:CspA family cold shock protein